ncbi:MAG TPA: alpha-amylase family glycosyl hydrolase [Opitutaceae bacterium]
MPGTYFTNANLVGSWDGQGSLSANWTTVSLTPYVAEDGCAAFTATVALDASQAGNTFNWGVSADTPAGPGQWVIPIEINDPNSSAQYRSFVLASGPATQEVSFNFSRGRRLGAQKYQPAGGNTPGIRFSAYAPYAQSVEVVFGSPATGYIDDQGGGTASTPPALPLALGTDGFWDSDPTALAFAAAQGQPYMLRLQDEQGNQQYRTDLYSRRQIGMGTYNPGGAAFSGTIDQLDGSVSCSVVVDPDSVTDPAAGPTDSTTFWNDEFNPGSPLPQNLQDLIIYELHIGALGFGRVTPGNLDDAIAFLEHLTLLGINAVELLPLAQCDGALNWGYGDTHLFAIQSAAGGRDDYKRFVRECHRRGIAVIQDVCYNHFDLNASRAEWSYDSALPNHNTYYWYEGLPSDYADPTGGYLDNGSSGWSPRFWDENVRAMFISSALTLVSEFHVDGFRVDLTTAIYRDNALHANGASVGNANAFGAKFLREWSRSLQTIKPKVFLIAEDYSDQPAITAPTNSGGMGFNATWYADFIHHLIGDGNYGDNYARLIHNAGLGDDRPLNFDYFAGALQGSAAQKVACNENHDEAGNEANTRRTIVEAVNGAPLEGATRAYAEARCRFAFGALLASAATPMFFMGEEVGTPNPFPLDSSGLLANRINFVDDRSGIGAHLFAFYADMIRFRLARLSLKSGPLRVVYIDNANRVVAWVRSLDMETLFIVANLNNAPFANGYTLHCDPTGLVDGNWQEVLNSDQTSYGGAGVGNAPNILPAIGGVISVRIPACGFVALSKH